MINKPVINPPANPSMIGKGKPGKIPFLSSMKKVMIEPTKMPITDIMYGRMLGKKVKSMTPVSME